jgi:hypothetical protein
MILWLRVEALDTLRRNAVKATLRLSSLIEPRSAKALWSSIIVSGRLEHKGNGLRWVLRDLAANRLKLSPANEVDLQDLVEMKLVELRDGIPHLTIAGATAIISSS